MTPPLTPALIAEQLAICDAAGTTADPHFAKFNEAAFDHYRAALEMAASNKLLQIALEQSWTENAKINAMVEESERKVKVFAGAHADVAALCDRERAENTKLTEKVAEYAQANFDLRENGVEITEMLDKLRTENNKLRMNVAFRNREITKFREALRFYGDEKSYEYGGDMGRALHSLDCDVVLDAGERARRALGE